MNTKNILTVILVAAASVGLVWIIGSNLVTSEAQTISRTDAGTNKSPKPTASQRPSFS